MSVLRNITSYICCSSCCPRSDTHDSDSALVLGDRADVTPALVLPDPHVRTQGISGVTGGDQEAVAESSSSTALEVANGSPTPASLEHPVLKGTNHTPASPQASATPLPAGVHAPASPGDTVQESSAQTETRVEDTAVPLQPPTNHQPPSSYGISRADLPSQLGRAEAIDSDIETALEEPCPRLDPGAMILEVIPQSNIELERLPFHPLPTLVDQGVRADIYKGTRASPNKMNEGSMDIVVKVVRGRFHLFSDALEKEEYIISIRRAYGPWAALRHPNVLRVEGLVLLADLQSPGVVYRYLQPGEALSSVIKRKDPFDRLSMARGISSGLKYLHSLNIFHGGLTALDILMEKDTKTGILSPVITDSGVWPIQDYDTSSGGHRIPYALQGLFPPEVILAQADDISTSIPTAAFDVYSLSILFVHIFSGLEGYSRERMPPYKLHMAIADVDRPLRPVPEKYRFLDNATNFCWPIMQDCWKHDPVERITSEEAYMRLCEGISQLPPNGS